MSVVVAGNPTPQVSSCMYSSSFWSSSSCSSQKDHWIVQQQQHHHRIIGGGDEDEFCSKDQVSAPLDDAPRPQPLEPQRDDDGTKESNFGRRTKTMTTNRPLREKNCSKGRSYKHVPHKEKPAQVVAKRNARERRRVHAVNGAFAKLRKAVPIENVRGKRISKVKTLQNAIDYIQNLQNLLDQDRDNSYSYHIIHSQYYKDQDFNYNFYEDEL